MELQIEELHGMAVATRDRAAEPGEKLTRLSFLMITTEMRVRLCELLRLSNGNFWSCCLNGPFKRNVDKIKVRAFTCKGKFRKLLLESYSDFRRCMDEYAASYKDLAGERDAVNHNIESFHKNFDLLSILCFLRNLDMQGLERKKILGGNFTAAEISQLDKNLYVKPIPMAALNVPPPMDLPESSKIEEKLSGLSEEIFRKSEKEVRAILK